MFARFMRFFPAYTLEAIMVMQARAFFAINRQIRILMAEEEAHALSVHHAGKPAERLKELADIIRGVDFAKAKASSSRLSLVAKGEASVEPVPGAIVAERERQRRASDEMMKDRQAWLDKLKEERERQAPQT